MANYRIDVLTDDDGNIIRPATITDNVINPENKKSVTEELRGVSDLSQKIGDSIKVTVNGTFTKDFVTRAGITYKIANLGDASTSFKIIQADGNAITVSNGINAGKSITYTASVEGIKINGYGKTTIEITNTNTLEYRVNAAENDIVSNTQRIANNERDIIDISTKIENTKNVNASGTGKQVTFNANAGDILKITNTGSTKISLAIIDVNGAETTITSGLFGGASTTPRILDVGIKAIKYSVQDGGSTTIVIYTQNTVVENIRSLEKRIASYDDKIGYDSNYEMNKAIDKNGVITDADGYLISKPIYITDKTTYRYMVNNKCKTGALCMFDADGNLVKTGWTANGYAERNVYDANVAYIIATFKMGDNDAGLIKSGASNYFWKPEAGLGFLIEHKADEDALKRYDLIESNRVHHVELLQQLLRPSRKNRGVDGLYGKPLLLMQFTDIHGDWNSVQSNIKKFFTEYSSSINDVISTGDNISDKWADSYDWWKSSGLGGVLNCIGNHDVWDKSTNPYTVKSALDGYERYFAPFIESWGVVAPADAATVGKCYYYKDYTSQKIRLVVLDCMHYDDAQNIWLQDVLSDAVSNDYGVVIAAHYPPKSGADKIISSFTSYDAETWNASDAMNSKAITSVDNFIASGGEFICWICGHTHVDYLMRLTSHNNQFVIVSQNAGNYGNNVYYCDCARVAGTKSGDSFNLIAIDRKSHIVKLARIGVNMDMWMRRKETFCYDYLENKMIYTD